MAVPHYGVSYQVYDGDKAITTQSFTELNSKAGNQFETTFYDEALGAGDFDDLVLITGSKPVVIKNVQVQFNSDLISIQIYRSPTYTGGTPLDIFNLTDINPATTTVSVLGGITVSAVGTAISPLEYSIGSGSAEAKRVAGTSGVERLERILAPNTTYLFRITDEAASSTAISAYATWYEGPLSTQTPLEA